MKRIFTLAAVLGLSAGLVFADEETLIDFSKLVSNLNLGTDERPNMQNSHTLLDMSNTKVGRNATAEQTTLLKPSLGLENWIVELASSSRNATNLKHSFVMKAESKSFFGGDTPTPVMGVRIHFPPEPWNSWAFIKPPFDIPVFNYDRVAEDGTITTPPDDEVDFAKPTRFEGDLGDDGNFTEDGKGGYGVIKNVATVKSMQVRVFSNQYPHSLFALIENDKGERKTMPLGALNFQGWRALTWDNPAYIQDVRARSLRLYPTYPADPGYIRFVGFIVQRDAANIGGDFVMYVKDVRVVYDKAELEIEQDVDNEGTWHIRRERESERLDSAIERFAETQVLRSLESQKQATEPYYDGATAAPPAQ